MKFEEFKKRFELAALFCRDFTGKHLTETLPDSLKFNFIAAKITDTKIIEINGGCYKKENLLSINAVETLKILYRDGQIPSWVDFYVDHFDQMSTYIAVAMSTEFTDDEEQLYKRNSQMPPFHVIGPTIPAGWQSLERDGKFSFIPFQ